MLLMAESLANTPSRLIISNGFGYSNNQECKFKCFLYVNSRILKQNLSHEFNARVVIRTRSVKVRKFVKFKVMVASIEHRLVCEQRIDSCVEGFDDDGDDERRQLRLSRNWNLGGGLDCGGVISEKMSIVSSGREEKVFSLEERGEEVMVSGMGENKVFSLEGRDDDEMVSRGGENKVFSLEERGEDGMVSRRGENKVFSLEERDEEVMVSRGGENKVFPLEGRDEGVMLSRVGENKVFSLGGRDEEVMVSRMGGNKAFPLEGRYEEAMVSRVGENKVFSLEGRDEEVMVSRRGGNKVFPLEGKDKEVMVSRAGENNKVFYLEERDEKVLSKRILSLTRSNRKTSALVLFRSMEMSGLRPNLHACNSLLACFARNNMFVAMLRVFEFMKRNKIGSGHSCSLVLKALAKHCGSDAALQVFLEWEGESEINRHFDSVVYNTMISIFGKDNDWSRMKKIWESMSENGIIGTEITYRVLVCTFVRCYRYENAIDAYSELLQNDLEPDIDTMHAVIGACAKEEKWDMALSVFNSMLKNGLKPNLVACNTLINLLGKAGKVKEAYKVYKHIRSLGHVPDSYTWKALLSAFYRGNQYTGALQLFDGIQKDLNFQPSSYLYNTALMCCQRLGYWEKALQYLWKMEESGITVSTESYNIVLSVCESAKKPKVALEIYEHMALKKCRPDTFTHLSLIRSCIWGDLWDEVDNILNESTPNVSLYNAAIQGMCLKRNFESAKNLYTKMRDLGLVADGKTRALMLQYMRRGT